MEKLKLNLQHFAESTGVSGIAIGVTNFYWAPIKTDDSSKWEVKGGHRTRFLKEIEVDRPQETEEEYGDNIVAATAVSNGKLSVKTTFVTIPAEQKAFLAGAKKGEGGFKYGANDIPPDVAVVFERTNHDGSSEWVGLFKGKFTRPKLSSQTKQDKIEFQNDEVEGSFVDRLFDESSHVTGFDKKGEHKGRDYVFTETFGKTYDEFISDLNQELEIDEVEKKMPGKTSEESVRSVTLSKESTVIKKGMTEQLSATTDPQGKPVTYRVTKGDEYISVNGSGLVTANAVGNGVVTATSGEQSDKINIEVQDELQSI
ncbi:major tail protein [Staphylococcus delphini]|uniref:major tail protein n=1 Tax=Staphylococcus delphini TaxID=53344 RepID=UPI0021D38C15|nr:major tail protein [Staphylococcus delphini]UXS43539.1 Ig-like domain-containing protein [Staphylococcus delphini]UXV44232.1 Ig-like domain-containing protein [Staphylococcus delphini]